MIIIHDPFDIKHFADFFCEIKYTKNTLEISPPPLSPLYVVFYQYSLHQPRRGICHGRTDIVRVKSFLLVVKFWSELTLFCCKSKFYHIFLVFWLSIWSVHIYSLYNVTWVFLFLANLALGNLTHSDLILGNFCVILLFVISPWVIFPNVV